MFAAFDDDAARRRDLVVGPAERLFDGRGLLGGAVGGEDRLVRTDAGGRADDLPERLPHPVGNTVRARTGCLFVLPDDLMGELPELHLVLALAELLQQVTVRREPRGLQRAVAKLDGL